MSNLGDRLVTAIANNLDQDRHRRRELAVRAWKEERPKAVSDVQ
jgi:hypothetical protein